MMQAVKVERQVTTLCRISNRYQLFFPLGIVRGHSHCSLFYDIEKKQIGFRFYSGRPPISNVWKISKGHGVSIMAVLKLLKLKPKGSYTPQVHPDARKSHILTPQYFIDLSNPVHTKRKGVKNEKNIVDTRDLAFRV